MDPRRQMVRGGQRANRTGRCPPGCSPRRRSRRMIPKPTVTYEDEINRHPAVLLRTHTARFSQVGGAEILLPAALIVCFAPMVLQACAGRPGEQEISARTTESPISVASATAALAPTATQTRPSTATPATSSTPAPSPTPTLGPLVTRTPAPPAVCPAAGRGAATIELGPDPESLVESLEAPLPAYLDA